MPASHAADHRSEAGQGRQFHCPQSILSDALLWYGSQLGATPGGGLHLNGRAQASQSSQRSGEHHKPAVPRAALGTATSLRFIELRLAGHLPPPCSSLWISFVKKSCRGSTGGRLHCWLMV